MTPCSADKCVQRILWISAKIANLAICYPTQHRSTFHGYVLLIATLCCLNTHMMKGCLNVKLRYSLHFLCPPVIPSMLHKYVSHSLRHLSLKHNPGTDYVVTMTLLCKFVVISRRLHGFEMACLLFCELNFYNGILIKEQRLCSPGLC